MNLYSLLLAVAEGAAPPAGNQQPTGAFAWDMMLPIGLIFLFYLFFIRPMMRQEAERKNLLSRMKKNDKVLTSAGIYGTIIAVSDTEDEITVKVDDNVRLRMTKGSILRNLTNEESAKEAAGASKSAAGAGSDKVSTAK
jgi:preprotein translocase subunit YajC